MALPCCEIVHIRLKILDDSALVCRCKVEARVRELHRSDCTVMGLENSFEVERQSVPNCEFTACRARYDTPSFRCPLFHGVRNEIDGDYTGARTTTQLTGQRILFVEVCTNLVHNDVE